MSLTCNDCQHRCEAAAPPNPRGETKPAGEPSIMDATVPTAGPAVPAGPGPGPAPAPGRPQLFISFGAAPHAGGACWCEDRDGAGIEAHAACAAGPSAGPREAALTHTDKGWLARPEAPGPAPDTAPKAARAAPARPKPPPAGPAPVVTKASDASHRSILSTSCLLVPLAAEGAYTEDQMRVYSLFGVEVQAFEVGGAHWVASVHGLRKAQEAVKSYLAGGHHPLHRMHQVPVRPIRVPYSQPKIDQSLELLYAALSLDTINICAAGDPGAVRTTLLDYVSEVRASVLPPACHEVPLAAVRLQEYYAGPPPPIIQTLAEACGVPYCRLSAEDGEVYWIAALDGAVMLGHAHVLGLYH